MTNELPEYFDNIVLGQYAMTGVPLKVYANDRYYIIPSPEDVDDPLIGYGMTPAGTMEPFDYRDIEHIMVSGNKVDLATYTKALGDELESMAAGTGKTDKPAADKPAADDEKKKEGGSSPFESYDRYAKKWSLKALYEISKDEYNAQEDALKAEMEAGKAKIDAAKDKMNDLKKQPIDDGVIMESVIGDILIIAMESTTYDKFISELISQKLLTRNDLRDPELVDELKTMYRGQAAGKRESVNEFRELSPKMVNNFKIGDVIKTQQGTYTITGFGRRANAFKEFEAENEKGKPFNLRISLRGASGISAAAGSRNLNFPEKEEMLESINEFMDHNDPFLIALRAAKEDRKKELAKPTQKRKPLYGMQKQKAEDMLWNISQDLKDLYDDRGQLISDLEQALIDMEQEAEAEGGPIADDYAEELDQLQYQLDAIEKEIQNLISKRSKLEISLAESVTNENHISEPYVFQAGDIIKNTNPQCKHYGSMGIVQSIEDMNDTGILVKYLVTNQGNTFKPGMALMKSPDQLEIVN